MWLSGCEQLCSATSGGMELLYQLALTRVPLIGSVQAKLLVDHFGSATSIFNASATLLEKVDGMGTVRAKSIKNYRNFAWAEVEIRFMEQYRIQPLFLTDKGYPKRLLNCYDPPTLLFYRGSANLNNSQVLAVIGTRSSTNYGKNCVDQLLNGLAGTTTLVISGLAVGIDYWAHRFSLINNLHTVAVLAHGLDHIYPGLHQPLAREIIAAGGGLLTEFTSGTVPSRHHFPSRNRIVAGMSDAVVAVESGERGGSMVTVDLANGYHRDVFAFPGRIDDKKSMGCNALIKSNQAQLLTGARGLLETMGWIHPEKNSKQAQVSLFHQLTDEEQKLLGLFAGNNPLSLDELNLRSGLTCSKVASALLSLEMQHLISSLPGKIYRLT